MFCWRVTKYNPKNRDHNGWYTKDEWTRYNDIGEIFEGQMLTEAEYVKIEDAYIQAVLLFVECLSIDGLTIVGLECIERRRKTTKIDRIIIKNNKFYPKKALSIIVQSILRNKFWCKLEYDDTMYVHFGWDYYMYVSSAKACKATIKKIEAMGLFVEKFRSPYFDEDEDEDEG